ncbi:MAG: fructose-bisphosphate aldolase class I [Chloroflexi bacterium]|nr:fructose-bisphosphate aldolase class I [Chloroflexota bacterium]MDA1271182.1 fructose-bisphosphate aldolase class I [Chloroflexota bacterium]PKB59305.1 MAG: fructose-bisphosphate aldolase [SAR202 cluster bacterium Casp-Chloro-G2]
MDKQRLVQTAQALVAAKKGILAADESSGTIKRRFDSINVESTEEKRRDYREMLFRTAGVNEFLSGVILFDETIRQNGADGTPLVKVLTDQGIIPGIKVDKGTVPLPEAPDELVTEGLDGLRDRLAEYEQLGAGFTKWRAVISIGKHTPTSYALSANAHALARFAAMSQEAGLVPIVEPEVLRDGGHSIEQCFEVTEETLREVFDQLAQQKVFLEGMLLKPSMVISGGDYPDRADPDEVAERTIDCFKRVLPASVPGVVFLSGGEPDGSVTANLNAINQRAPKADAPWELSFSFGRSLQGAPLAAWAGKVENTEAAALAFYNRARLTSAARQGTYVPESHA